MVVINLTLTTSDDTTNGIPNFLTIEANIPCTIFYTFDLTIPNYNSTVYLGPIPLPNYLSDITIKILATNGVDSSGVISQTYTADLTNVKTRVGDRVAQSTVSNLGNSANNNSKFPFGDNSAQLDFNYLQSGNPDNTVFDQSKPSSPNAFDADGNPAGFSNNPLPPFGAPQSDTDFLGQTGKGIGNKVPVEIIGKQNPVEYEPEISSKANKVFNPKAMVIYLDSSTDDPSNPQIIMRPYFSLENAEVVKDGALNFSAIGQDTATITGSFVRRTYNPNTHELTYYYRDSATNRWVISKCPFSPTPQNVNNLSQFVFGRDSSKVFPWILFQRRVLP